MAAGKMENSALSCNYAPPGLALPMLLEFNIRVDPAVGIYTVRRRNQAERLSPASTSSTKAHNAADTV